MKALIIYVLTWFLVLAVAASVNLNGYSNAVMETVFGLIFVTLFFAGAVMGFPFWVGEQHNLEKITKI